MEASHLPHNIYVGDAALRKLPVHGPVFVASYKCSSLSSPCTLSPLRSFPLLDEFIHAFVSSRLSCFRVRDWRFGSTTATDILSSKRPSGYSLSLHEHLVLQLERFTAAVEFLAFFLGTRRPGTVLSVIRR